MSLNWISKLGSQVGVWALLFQEHLPGGSTNDQNPQDGARGQGSWHHLAEMWQQRFSRNFAHYVGAKLCRCRRTIGIIALDLVHTLVLT